MSMLSDEIAPAGREITFVFALKRATAIEAVR